MLRSATPAAEPARPRDVNVGHSDSKRFCTQMTSAKTTIRILMSRFSMRERRSAITCATRSASLLVQQKSATIIAHGVRGPTASQTL